jgi:type IV pilus assembly protein PilX
MELKNKQKGVVLIVALVFLISLTAVASALMLNTTTDIKMSGASEEKLIAVQEAISAVDETISDQIMSGNNLFETDSLVPLVVGTVTSVDVTDATITNRNNIIQSVTCPHTRLASGGSIGCKMRIVTVNNNYGRNDTSNVAVEAGIMQEVIKVQQ